VKPTHEERVKNRQLAQAILRELFPKETFPLSDAAFDVKNPAIDWLECILHDVREGKR
jgi:hypothetical protein